MNFVVVLYLILGYNNFVMNIVGHSIEYLINYNKYKTLCKSIINSNPENNGKYKIDIVHIYIFISLIS